MLRRIAVAVACIKVASQAVAAMPSILLFPLLPFILEARARGRAEASSGATRAVEPRRRRERTRVPSVTPGTGTTPCAPPPPMHPAREVLALPPVAPDYAPADVDARRSA
jgi:hypothetical protein